MTTSVILKPEIARTTDIDSVTCLSQLLAQCEGKTLAIEADWLEALRQQATSNLAGGKIPSKHEEEWRFTDLSKFSHLNFQLPGETSIAAGVAQLFMLPEAKQTRLAFANGIYCPQLSDLSALPAGVWVGNLKNLSGSQIAQIVKYLGQQPGAEEVFTALNTAGLTDVAVVWATRNAIVETPIHLLFLTVATATPTFSQPRGLVVAEEGSSLQLVEYYGAITENCSDIPQNHFYFTNAVTEIWLGENAQVNHSRIQRESGDGFHLGKSAIAQERNSNYTCNEISLGGKLYRHNLAIFQRGEQTETTLNGLAMVTGEQVADTHSALFLAHPYGTANQLHKCIVDGSARAVFSGKISVPKAAQMTNASQLNRNLLLSPKARVNTKPELQIIADNVKCAHGATVSQLEADELFYLRSRGLTETDAKHLLLDAFAADILGRLPLPSLRQRLTQCVTCRTYEL